jgi:exopolysaccharide biosynthesis operon protein EpsL
VEAGVCGERRSMAGGGSPHRAEFRWRSVGAAILLVGGLTPATDANALWGDRLELFAAETITHDSNVFRLSSRQNAESLLGTPSTADTYYTTSFGLNLDVPLSRQRFLGGLTWNDNRFERFSQLNSTGRDGRATWLWQAGNDWSGQLGYRETLTAASLLDTHGVTPDPIERKQTFFNAAYLLTPRWRLQAGVNSLSQRNGAPLFKAEDVDIDSTEFTASYITPSGNSVGLNLRLDNGRFPNPEFVAGIAFDNAYEQYTASVASDWVITGQSHLNARVGLVSRKYGQLPQRDFDGVTYRAAYDWKPSGKLSLSLIAHQDITTVTDVQTSFALVKGITLQPTLNLTEKTSVSATLDYSVYDYRGNPALALGAVPQETDRVRSELLTVSYRPSRVLAFLISAQHQTRTSTIPFLDFATNVISVTGRVSF